MVKKTTLRIRDWAPHGWGALSVALALAFGVPSLVVAGHYKRTPWWVWPGIALAAIFFVGAFCFFAVPLLRKRSHLTSELDVAQTPAIHAGGKPDPELGHESAREAEPARERIGYRVSTEERRGR
jgi:hypothetical protein